MTFEKHRGDSSHISTRISNEIFFLFNELKKISQLSTRHIIELGILEVIYKTDSNFTYNGVNLKDYGELCYLEKMRNITKKERNEFMSKELFILRMKGDLWKLVLALRENPNKSDNLFLDYFDKRRKEANFYKDKNSLLEEVNMVEKKAKNDIPKLLIYLRDNTDLRNDFSKQLLNSGEKKK